MRLFVGLYLPWVLRDRLSALAGGGIPGARWVPPTNYHLTLRFIGETPGYRAEDIDVALAGLRARGFSLTLAGLGTFAKGGRSTSLWVGVERNPQSGDGAADELILRLRSILGVVAGQEGEVYSSIPEMFVGVINEREEIPVVLPFLIGDMKVAKVDPTQNVGLIQRQEA